MSRTTEQEHAGAGSTETGPAQVAPPPFAWRQFLAITIGALAVFVGFRWLPTGTNLNHMDFRVDAKAGRAIEFCDPANPQFIPVVTVKSPVTVTLATAGPAQAGRELKAVLTLKTASGKPVAPEDLLITHTRRLHLLVVDPTLDDYQHLHPEATRVPGEWVCTFTPRRAGTYRVFADFTPAATGRGLYAGVDLEVAADPASDGARPAPTSPPLANAEVEHRGFRFGLAAAPTPARAAQPIDLRFSVRATDGGEVRLGEVMGAYAHLVAFDAARTGFAHLHPVEEEPGRGPDPREPVLRFRLTIPQAGRYTIWAQVNLRGQEEFVPFGLEVRE